MAGWQRLGCWTTVAMGFPFPFLHPISSIRSVHLVIPRCCSQMIQVTRNYVLPRDFCLSSPTSSLPGLTSIRYVRLKWRTVMSLDRGHDTRSKGLQGPLQWCCSSYANRIASEDLSYFPAVCLRVKHQRSSKMLRFTCQCLWWIVSAPTEGGKSRLHSLLPA